MPGRAAVAMWWDIAPELQAEFEDWHSHEHMPERLAIPGFLRGTRCIDISGQPSYFVLYETTNLKTITSGSYLDRLNNPTPWSQKMMPHHRNMMRSLCRVRASAGGTLGHAVATVRFSPRRGKGGSLRRWLAELMPGLAARKGLVGLHLLESEATPGTPQTAEQRIRGGDASADSVLLVSGYDADAVQAVLAGEFNADALAARGASPGAVQGVYRIAYALTSRDIQT